MSETKQEIKMEVRYAHAKQFREIIKALAIMQTEIPLQFDTNGLTSQFMDPSHVAMAQLEIPRTSFDDYNVYGPVKLCFLAEDLTNKALRNIHKYDVLRLNIDGDEAILTLLGDMKRNFKLSTLEPDETVPPTPKISYNVTFKMALEAVARIIKDIKGLGAEALTLTGNRENIVFSAADRYNVTLDKGNIHILNISSRDTPQKATYDLTYFSAIVTALKTLTDVIEISFSKDMPVQIKTDLSLEPGGLTYWMAPRIGGTDE